MSNVLKLNRNYSGNTVIYDQALQNIVVIVLSRYVQSDYSFEIFAFIKIPTTLHRMYLIGNL